MKLKRFLKLKVLAGILLIVGIGLWGVVVFRMGLPYFARNDKLLPIGGSSDMIRRTMAINEAIKNGEKSYSYEAAGPEAGPPMMRENNEELQNKK